MGGDVSGDTKRWRPSLRQWPRVRAVALPAWKIVSQTLEGFSRDRGDLLAAALDLPVSAIATAFEAQTDKRGSARRGK